MPSSETLATSAGHHSFFCRAHMPRRRVHATARERSRERVGELKLGSKVVTASTVRCGSGFVFTQGIEYV
eukprot:scaffold46437_cov62-Phaeocystis_antarctica.AAC.2